MDSEGQIVFENVDGLGDDLNVGTADLNGYLYLYLSASDSLLTIDIDPMRSTYLKVVDPTNGYSEIMASPWKTKLEISQQVSDFAFNPVDNLIYGVIDNFGPGIPYKYQIAVLDPTTGTFTRSGITVTGSDIQNSDAFGSCFIDGDGNFMVFANNSGKLYKVDPATNTALHLSTSVMTGNNDGAFCGSASYSRIQAIPTMGQWAIIFIALTSLILGVVFFINRVGQSKTIF